MDMFPAVDPIPLPAPVWIFKVLLDVTLVLHFFAVYLLVGGIALATWWSLRGWLQKDALCRDASGAVAKRLPIVMAYVINLGIPPLLFTQVLYGRGLYTSSILIGVFWIMVIGLLMATYFLLYWMSARAGAGKAFALAGLVALLLVLKIGYIYSNNMTLMLRPDAWAAMYAKSAHGAALAKGDPTILPRWLFMMVSSLAVSGAGILLLSLRPGLSAELSALFRRRGAMLLAVFSLVEIGTGAQAYLAQPAPVQEGLRGGTLYLSSEIGWVVLSLTLVALGILILLGKGPKWMPWAVCGALFLQVLALVLFRDGIRDVSLAQFDFDVWDRAVNTNWGVVGVFLVLFVVMAASVAWMTAVMAHAKGGEEDYV